MALYSHAMALSPPLSTLALNEKEIRRKTLLLGVLAVVALAEAPLWSWLWHRAPLLFPSNFVSPRLCKPAQPDLLPTPRGGLISAPCTYNKTTNFSKSSSKSTWTRKEDATVRHLSPGNDLFSSFFILFQFKRI